MTPPQIPWVAPKRRTVAACKVGLTTVPVYVLAATAADTAAETIDRIVHQIVTNDQKRDLSDAQRARGIQQMIGAGLSVTRVAKILRTKAAKILYCWTWLSFVKCFGSTDRHELWPPGKRVPAS